ncbi:HK97-gp10 family putative phage morphogenesis protein [Noviherbaspirillum autotrophicum]|uniref:HK97-gp10 family putative phage morphogenesis protein n=1 Tax=Noviherbaspirillum autotrophicum TaxID=709839 RepID=UPI00069338FF|nr:HK97-gp10 family putative phage morphogenesis protein [Noviherbaspirillum autotrophicum]
MPDSFTVKFDFDDLKSSLDHLTDVIKENARPAAQAGAQVLYEEVLRLVPVAKSARMYKGKLYEPGALKAAIYQAFSVDNSGDGVATYHVSWNAAKAPHGHLIENGHWTKKQGKYGPLQPVFVPAHPFIRPAYDTKIDDAIEASNAVMSEAIDKTLEKLN